MHVPERSFQVLFGRSGPTPFNRKATAMKLSTALLLFALLTGSVCAQEARKEANLILKVQCLSRHDGQAVFAVHFDTNISASDRDRGITLVSHLCKHNLDETGKIQTAKGRTDTTLLVIVDVKRTDRTDAVDGISYLWSRRESVALMTVHYREEERGRVLELFHIFVRMNHPGKEGRIEQKSEGKLQKHEFLVTIADQEKK